MIEVNDFRPIRRFILALPFLMMPALAEAQAVVAPLVAAPQSGGLVSVTIENDGKEAAPARIVTFGQAFLPGAVPKGHGIVAAMKGTPLKVALDAKAHHADGSVRHGIVALEAPALAPGERAIVTLSLGEAAAAPPLKLEDFLLPGYEPKLTLAFEGEPARTIDVAALVREAFAKGKPDIWLDNALAKEIRVQAKLNQAMTATFDIRALADGQLRTDVIVANDQAFVPIKFFTCDASIANGGTTLFERKGMVQYPYSNWHKELWTGTAHAPLHVSLDPAYLAKAGAIADYDFSLGVSMKALGDRLSELSAAKSGPLEPSLITPAMGTTGGRTDIGITTGWAANYLVSQDRRAETVMLAEADHAGSVPWHLRDGATNAPISVVKHPTSWADYREGKGVDSADRFGTVFNSEAAKGNGGWALDSAHEPDLSFVPYLVTGNRYYLDELDYEAAYLTVAGNPGYRHGAEALVYPVNQLRGTAWNIRDFANAAWIAPDNDPLKSTFASVTEANLAGLVAETAKLHAAGAEGEIEGYVPDIPFGSAQTAPWQNDFLALTMALIAKRGDAKAETVLAWLDHFNSGRFTHGAKGFNPLNGPGYWWTIAGTQDNKGIAPNTWAQLYQRNFGDKPAPTELANTPECTYCYPAVAAASAAESFSVTRSPQAIWAYAYLTAHTPALRQPNGYLGDPGWHMTPVLPDGYRLRQADIELAPPGGGNVTAASAHALLAGGAGKSTLQGGKGVTVIYAGSGGATMIAGGGTTYLIAGAGEGGKPSELIIDASAEAEETVLDFDPAFDKIEIRKAAGLSLGTAIAADGKGGSILTLGPAHKVLVPGLAPAMLTPAVALR